MFSLTYFKYYLDKNLKMFQGLFQKTMVGGTFLTPLPQNEIGHPLPPPKLKYVTPPKKKSYPTSHFQIQYQPANPLLILKYVGPPIPQIELCLDPPSRPNLNRFPACVGDPLPFILEKT